MQKFENLDNKKTFKVKEKAFSITVSCFFLLKIAETSFKLFMP